MIKSFTSTDLEAVDDFVNNFPEPVWATQTDMIISQSGIPLHKAVVFYGKR